MTKIKVKYDPGHKRAGFKLDPYRPIMNEVKPGQVVPLDFDWVIEWGSRMGKWQRFRAWWSGRG